MRWALGLNQPPEPAWWVVDYDLPAGPPGVRRSFYRAVKRYLRETKGIGDWSTQSVLVTQDKDFAEFVWGEAVKRGRAHIYKARLLR